jgi:hypothetical protein
VQSNILVGDKAADKTTKLSINHLFAQPTPTRAMITKETLIGFFDDTRKLKATGKARFDIDDECRWSYFFTDTDRGKLIEAGRHLETIGYEVRGFLDPSPDDEKQTIFLRFDKVETHTPESLFERNTSLYALADRFGLDSYDGMDVGAVDGP